MNLLGLPVVTAFNLIIRADINTVTNHDVKPQLDIYKQFPSVFKGLGNLGE